MHIPPFDNKNIPIVDINNSKVPLNYFNIVKLQKNESYEYQVPGYETCIVPSTGTIDIEVQEFNFKNIVECTFDINFVCVHLRIIFDFEFENNDTHLIFILCVHLIMIF